VGYHSGEHFSQIQGQKSKYPLGQRINAFG